VASRQLIGIQNTARLFVPQSRPIFVTLVTVLVGNKRCKVLKHKVCVREMAALSLRL
jgi:hypothetical protein